MTKGELRERLALYVLAAMLTVAATDIGALRDTDTVGVIEFIIKTLLAGVITWRAFIDKSVVQEAVGTKIDAMKSKLGQVGLLLAMGGLLLLTGCVTKLSLGSEAQYGRVIVGYELPDLHDPHYDRF